MGSIVAVVNDCENHVARSLGFGIRHRMLLTNPPVVATAFLFLVTLPALQLRDWYDFTLLCSIPKA
jgi:hypothetical protein